MRYVNDEIGRMPRMKRHKRYFDDITRRNKLAYAMEEETDDMIRYHVVSVESAWGRRAYSASIDGFYLGYRAAIAILEKVEPQNWPAPAMERKIISNNMAAKVREVPIGKRTFIVRRPVVPVNEENVYVLQLLDLLKNLDVYLDESYDVAHDKVFQFVRIHGITKKDVDSYIREFPIAVFKSFL